MGDETRDVTAIKLLMRNERQYRRLYVLGFVTEPAHSGMQPALPIPVETLAPPFDSVTGNWRLGAGKNQPPTPATLQLSHNNNYFSMS